MTKGHQTLWRDQLNSGLSEMGIQLSEGQQRQLLDYLTLLLKWNRAYNLTAIRDPNEMVSRQLLDSLSILHLIKGAKVLDVGTGAGLPGIPLAIACPEKGFTLLDSNGKKTRFVQQAKLELGLQNIQVMQSRVEALPAKTRFETITSRALASLPRTLQWCSHLIAEGGCLLAMKGTLPKEEIAQLETDGNRIETHHLQVPGTPGERHALLITLPSPPKP